MATFAPPVRQGEFLYSSVLYADAGNGNHHPRASIAELAALLRPEAPTAYTKSRKPEPAKSAKDQVGHWYSAQLLHYGLSFTKDKNAAKVRLLNAMNGIKLEVPAWILKVENELKSEWDAKNRKLKKAATVARGYKAAKLGKITKGDGGIQGLDNSVNVTVNLSFPSGLSFGEPFGSTQRQNHLQAATKSASGKRKWNENSVAPSAPKTPKRQNAKKQSARGGVEDHEAVSQVTEHNYSSPPAKEVRIKQERSQIQSPPPRPRAKQEAGLRGSESPQPQIKQEPSAYHSIPEPGSILLSGTYIIDCPVVQDMFPDLDPRSLILTLSRDEQRDLWWATFCWAAWQGIIQMNPGPSYGTLGQACSLGWRLRDLNTGDLKFGKKCTGELTFYDNQSLTGCLFNVPHVGTVDFWGDRLPGPRIEDDLQIEWDEYVKQAYGL